MSITNPTQNNASRKSKRFSYTQLFYALLMVIFITGVAPAQNVDITNLNQTIPLNPKVRTGQLPNGIKYYIQKNSKPDKRVELRLAVNVGSLMEDDDQQGLAHFVEHMCFNGTKNFKKNELISYLQSVGVQFGAHVNAYTSFDETVYMLTLPTDKKDIVDKGFQILEDWAHNVTFEDVEIDKERGVVIEEWRRGLGADKRFTDKVFPVIFKGSKYAERLPIGKKEILESCSYETLKRFYREWYRPDLMSVVVVGDIDESLVESKIKEHFSKIAPVNSPRERQSADIPDHKEVLVTTATDKEASITSIELIYKQPAIEVKTYADFRRTLLYDIFSGMLGRRFREISQQPAPPFAFAYGYYGDMLRNKSAYTIYSIVNENGIESALKTILAEDKRLLDHGFTAAELDNYKKAMLANYENSYNERDKTNSAYLVYQYIDNSLTNRPSPGIEWQYDFVQKVLPTITLAEINSLAKNWIKNENLAVSITAPSKVNVKIPSEDQIKNLLNESTALKTEPYVFKEVTGTLMASVPTAGSIINERKIENLGITELTLSNGIKVTLKPTDFKNDEIAMSAFRLGGTSLAGEEDYISAIYAANLISTSGVAGFSATDLTKLLSGKNLYVFPSINQFSERLYARATPKDLETMLQLLNLYFVQPRKDEKVFQSMINKEQVFLQSYFADPESVFDREVMKTLYQNHHRVERIVRPENINKVNFEKAFRFYQERFSDAGGFQFTFIGNFQVDQIKPLLATYLGSLPGKEHKETFVDHGIKYPMGMTKRELRAGKDPKSIVSINFTGDLQSDGDGFNLRALSQLLTIKLIENLREEKGNIYSTRANAIVEKYPTPNYRVSVYFTCAPENLQKLVDAVYEEIRKIQQNGPTEADLNKVKEAQRRDLERGQRENYYWLSLIERAYYEKSDLQEVTTETFTKKIDELSSESLQKVAQKYLQLDSHTLVTMNPEK